MEQRQRETEDSRARRLARWTGRNDWHPANPRTHCNREDKASVDRTEATGLLQKQGKNTARMTLRDGGARRQPESRIYASGRPLIESVRSLLSRTTRTLSLQTMGAKSERVQQIIGLGITMLLAICMPSVAAAQRTGNLWEHRWVLISPNLFKPAEATRVNAIITRASNAGFNGVVINTNKIEQPARLRGDSWNAGMSTVRQHAADMGIHFRLVMFRLGRGLLSHDGSLVTGLPIVNMPLQRAGNELVPLPTANIENGSFERHVENEFDGWQWQTTPGVSSFADAVERVSGNYSARFEDFKEGHDRNFAGVWQTIDVMPFQQYRLKVWFKMENLTLVEM